VTDEASVESSETVGVHLVANTHYDFGTQANAAGIIQDNDTLPLLHISNSSAVEGNNLIFHVALDRPADHDITFQAFTDTGTHARSNSDPTLVNFGTATAGNLPGGDYDGFTPQTYTIHAGDTSVDISIHTRTDLATEGNETMSLRLTNANGATIGTGGIGEGRGVGTIIDNPPAPTTHVSFYADAANITEGQDLVFHFHRDITSSALDVKYWMGTFPLNGATPGTDFTADNTAFTFVPKVDGSADFEAGQDHWASPSMFVHFNAGQSDTTLVLHTTADGIPEQFGEGFTVQFDFVNNDPHVVFDGAASQAAYLAAFPLANQTQLNIGHIVDF
jgi:hypothetical protein